MIAAGLIVVISAQSSDWEKVTAAHKKFDPNFNALWSSWALQPPQPNLRPSFADIVFVSSPDDAFRALINGAIDANREILVAAHPDDFAKVRRDLKSVSDLWLVTNFHHMEHSDIIWRHLREVVSHICNQNLGAAEIEYHTGELRLRLAKRRARFVRASAEYLFGRWMHLVMAKYPEKFDQDKLVSKIVGLGFLSSSEIEMIDSFDRRIINGEADLNALRDFLLGQDNEHNSGLIAKIK